MRVTLTWIICNWQTSAACQETVLWTSVSDCEWCHPRALTMCRGGKRAPLRFCITAARLQHFGTFIKCYHNRSPSPFGLHRTSAKRISAPGLARLWGNTDCMLIQARCEETWEGEMLLDSLSHSVCCWCLQLEHLSLLVLLELCFPLFFFQPECLMSCVVTGTALFRHMMSCRATLSTGKFIWWAPDGVWS